MTEAQIKELLRAIYSALHGRKIPGMAWKDVEALIGNDAKRIEALSD